MRDRIVIESLERRTLLTADFGFALAAGSDRPDEGRQIATDGSGNVYVTGTFEDTADFQPGSGATNLTSAGGTDVFVAKYSASGALVWARRVGGSEVDAAGDIAVDASGNVLLTGTFKGTADFNPGAGTANLTSAANGGAPSDDAFVLKLNDAGNFVWAKRFGGGSTDTARGLAVDAAGNVYTAGQFFSATVDFDPGAGTTNLNNSGSGSDVYISKLNAAGNFVFARRLGGAGGADVGHAITVDAAGNIYTTGSFAAPGDFDPGAGTVTLTPNGGGADDVFVSKLNAGGNFVWAKRFGGSQGGDAGLGIAVDVAGNVFTTGTFRGTVDFDPGAGTFNLVAPTSGGNPRTDVFVSKLNKDGDFVVAREIGNDDKSEIASDLALDANGNVYTTGRFFGTVDFDPGAGTFDISGKPTGGNAFVSKLTNALDFVWARAFVASGAGGASAGNGIAITGGGAVYTTGAFSTTTDFDPGAGTQNRSSDGNTFSDVFISRLEQRIPDFSGVTPRVGGANAEVSNAVASDAAGNVYVTGSFKGTVDFDPSGGAFNLTSGGVTDIFVAKYNRSGALLWARRAGAGADDAGQDLAVDAAGNVYITGGFHSTVDFNPGAGTANLTSSTAVQTFVWKLNKDGNFVWAKAVGGTFGDGGQGIAVRDGNVHVTGQFSLTADFNPGAGTFNMTSAGSSDAYVMKLAAGDGAFGWAKRWGGTGQDRSLDIAIDADGNVYTTGAFRETVDFNPGAGTTNLTSAAFSDVFVSKLDSAGNFAWARRMGGGLADDAYGIALDNAGNVYTTGQFSSSNADFNPGAGTFTLDASNLDAFVSKLDNSGNFVWAKRMGSKNGNHVIGRDIAVDAAGVVYTAGSFGGIVDFDPNGGTTELTGQGRDVFVSRLTSTGNLLSVSRMGGAGNDDGYGLALGGSASYVYTTGTFTGTADFDPRGGTANRASAGLEDLFISKLIV